MDPETGRVRVDKIVAAHDCGKALNPLTVEGQIEGSVYMGFGQALQEEMIWESGRLMNPSLLEYRIPSTLENPEIESIIVESEDPEGPFGAKEAAKVRSRQRFRPSRTPSMTPSVCASTRSRLRRRRFSKPFVRSRRLLAAPVPAGMAATGSSHDDACFPCRAP